MQQDSDVEEISLIVEGLPPAKDGANSIFNAKHGHHPRVVNLLRAAKQTLVESHWNPTEGRRIGLELVTSDGLPGDAINYLGGVADVLQVARINVDLSHLGDLAKATLYYDDKQIAEVRYSVESGDATCYRVRVWVL